MNPVFGGCLVIIWLFVLYILTKANLSAWRFLWGALGLFALLMIFLMPVLTQPFAKCVCALAGVVGKITGTFTPYFKYGILYVPTGDSSITLLVDMECSGVIEVMAFISLLVFFKVYSMAERVIVGVAGVAYIMLCNALRILLICLSVHFFGTDAYYIVHTFIGRIVFYALSVLLYFYVFTKPQVIQMKVGNFTYGHNKKNS
ncbi:MAG: exosortase family protein XrtG [Lachnospiraceae bacterium]